MILGTSGVSASASQESRRKNQVFVRVIKTTMSVMENDKQGQEWHTNLVTVADELEEELRRATQKYGGINNEGYER
jgi:ssDNA-binding replication factor A large subunit